MAILCFVDILQKVGIEPHKVKLIRHSLTDKRFKACYDADMVYEYTCHQKNNFSDGYDYWAVFISGKGTLAKFYSLYRVNGKRIDNKRDVPKDLPEIEASQYDGNHSLYDLERIDVLKEYENKLTIEWGRGTRSWAQKGSTEKPIISIQPEKMKVFTGFEGIVLSYDELKDIVYNPTGYSEWHTALSSVHAIYLIVDTENGKQYVGSAYGKDGLLGRWSCYVSTKHGNNKLIKETLCKYPERYHKFQFSILQVLPKTLAPQEITDIENLYKKKLLSVDFGMNAN